MNRIALVCMAMIAASGTPIIIDVPQAVAQSETSRCTVFDNGGTVDVAVSLTTVLPSSGAGGMLPHVLGVIDVTPSAGAGPSATFHAITTRGAGSQDRSTDAGGMPNVRCASFSAPAPISRSTCTLSGDASSQTAVVSLLLPAVQRREASAPSMSERESATPRFSDRYQVVLVPSSDTSVSGPRISCDRPNARRGGPRTQGWDVAIGRP